MLLPLWSLCVNSGHTCQDDPAAARLRLHAPEVRRFKGSTGTYVQVRPWVESANAPHVSQHHSRKHDQMPHHL